MGRGTGGRGGPGRGRSGALAAHALMGEPITPRQPGAARSLRGEVLSRTRRSRILLAEECRPGLRLGLGLVLGLVLGLGLGLGLVLGLVLGLGLGLRQRSPQLPAVPGPKALSAEKVFHPPLPPLPLPFPLSPGVFFLWP